MSINQVILNRQVMKKYFFPVLFMISVFNFVNGQGNRIYPFDYLPGCQLKVYLAPAISHLKNDAFYSVSNRLGYSGGLDFLYYLKNAGRFKPAISLGLNYTIYKSGIRLDYSDSTWITDAVNDRVLVYEQGEISEKQEVRFLSLPLQIYLDFSVSARVGVYLNAGYYFSFYSSGKYSSDILLSRQGYYPRYNVLIYDVDVEGSQYFYPANKRISDTKALHLTNSNGYIAAIGLRWHVSSSYSMYFGIKGLIGMNNISGYASDDNFIIANNQYHMNSIMAMGDDVKANAWGVEFGLSVNLGKNKVRNVFQLLQKIRQKTNNH